MTSIVGTAMRQPHSRSRYASACFLSLTAALYCAYLVNDIAPDLADVVELRHEVFWSSGTVLVAVISSWVVVTGRFFPKRTTMSRLMPKVLAVAAFAAWVLLLGHMLHSFLGGRPSAQFDIIVLALVAAGSHLGIVFVGVLNPHAFAVVAGLARHVKLVVFDSAYPLLIVSSAFVLATFSTEAWMALLQVSWPAILLIWLVCATSASALVSRVGGHVSISSRTGHRPWTPMRNVGLLLAISTAAVVVFFALGGTLVSRETAEVWMGLRTPEAAAEPVCVFECENDGTAYISVLGKISLLLSGMAMIGSIGSIRESNYKKGDDE